MSEPEFQKYQLMLCAQGKDSAHTRTWDLPQSVYHVIDTIMSNVEPSDEGIISREAVEKNSDLIDLFESTTVTRVTK